MFKRNRGIIWAVLGAAWLLVLGKGVGPLPALGPLLSLHNGIWRHHLQEWPDQLPLENLNGPVQVSWDESGVPHIFAENEADLYRVQGYLMASQRLFQMELITRVASGRLSEWFGERTRSLDEFFTRFGMRESAERTLADFMKDPGTATMLEAFSDGVNQYITNRPSDPAEYLILNREPEPFTPIKTIFMSKSLTFNLAGRSFDLYLSQIMKERGFDFVMDLFPDMEPMPYRDIIYPTPRLKSADSRRRGRMVEGSPFVTSLKSIPFFPWPSAGKGSNNWAVNAKKSSTGYSLMANDTHLSLTLPNIWWEVQLSGPDFNVYGASLTAVPGIVNGMNAQASWGPTNGTTDVLDFYEIEFENESSNRYRKGDQVVESEIRNEQVGLKNGRTIEIPVIKTEYGYVLYREGSRGLAADWLAHKSNNELGALRQLYNIRSVEDCFRAFQRWNAPIQNFICVDRKSVGLQHTGILPDRQAQPGRFVRDGVQDTASSWATLSNEMRPRDVDPPSGFVLSANERPLDDEKGVSLGWDFEEPWRGMIIRKRLSEKSKISPADMIRFQNDAFNLKASFAAPSFLKLVAHASLSQEQEEALLAISKWDFQDLADRPEGALFRLWFEVFQDLIYSDEYSVPSRDFYPKESRTVALLDNVLLDPTHSDHAVVDDRRTQEDETPEFMVTKAFQLGWEELKSTQGSEWKKWRFRDVIQTGIRHVGRFPGFGVDLLTMDGGPESIRGNKGKHGAVYKIVVAHGEDWPRAWIQIPGGNEGDPLNPNYARYSEDWAQGKMREAQFFKTAEEARRSCKRNIIFQPPKVH